MGGSGARPGGYKSLSHSPEAHQNFEGSTPELCSGVHQKGCDLEGVEGATPHTSLTHFKAMTALKSQAQITELTDDQLEAVQGGNLGRAAVQIMYEHARRKSPGIALLEWFGGGRAPWQ